MPTRITALTMLVLSLLVATTLVAAQGHLLETTDNDRFGIVLTDAEGKSLYVYTNDTVGEGGSVSNCVDACTRNWPPVLGDGDLSVGEGVSEALLGTIERADGTVQVTYNGWPLYRYARDANAGDIRGQRLGGTFFLVSPAGSPVKDEVDRSVDIDPQTFADLMARGQQVFANCAACHGDRGQGLVGPGFAGNGGLARTDFVVPMVMDGFPEHGMPAWRNILSDWEIAAVITFIRNSWGNEFGAVTEEVVAAER